MSVAARVAGWQRLARNLPGPLTAPSGDSPSGAPVQVELFVGGVWVDITSSVMTRDGNFKISITRGLPDESSRTNPGRCTFQLNNRNGQFSPRNPTGPYFGQLGRNQQLRVSVPLGNNKSYRFFGEVPAWPQRWDKTGTDVWVEVEAAGILRRLGQGSAPLRSPLYRGLTSAALVNPPVAYWPCEDMAGASSVASGIGGPAMSIAGSPTLHSSSAFIASDLLPVMASGSSFIGKVPTYSPSGQTQVRFLLLVPSAGGVDHTVMCRFTTSGTAQIWELYYATGGAMGLRAFTSTGTSVGDSGAVSFGLNGKAVRVSVELTESGGNVNFAIATVAPGASVGSVFTGTFTSATVGSVNQVQMAPNGDQAGLVMGHVSVQSLITSLFDLGSQLAAFNGEAAGDRVNRLCVESGVPVGSLGDSVAMGPQGIKSFLDLIQECVDADMGFLLENRAAGILNYFSRSLNYNQSSALALSYTNFDLYETPVPVDDDRYTRNDITVTRSGGSSARATLSTGALSILPPPAGVGSYSTSLTVNIQSDSTLADQAGWRLHLGTVDEPRYPVIGINLARPSFVNNPLLRAAALNFLLTDRLTITGLPSWLPPGDASQIILSSTETIDHFQHTISFNGAPESPYHVAVADDTFFARVDTDGSTLAAGALSTDTALSIATADSFPTWTTDLAEPPFDLQMGGERMTVVAVGTVLSSNAFILTDLTGWNSQGSTISYDTSIVNTVHGAVASILIVPDGVSVSGGVRGNLTGVGTVTPGAQYTVCMWCYSPGGWSDLRPCVDWFDSSGSFLSSGLGSGTSVAAGVWTFIKQTLTAPASSSQGVVRGRHGGTPAASNTWYAWGIRLVPAASVSSVSPQTMTVIRSVNGVVKPQTVGTDVRLFQPAIAAL